MGFAAIAPYIPMIMAAIGSIVQSQSKGGSMFGSDPSAEKIDISSKGQKKFNNQLMDYLGQNMKSGSFGKSEDYLSGLFGKGAYDKFADPYLQQFKSKVLPSIEERYAGQGALSSSGFGQAVGGASADLQSQLAQMFSDLQMKGAEQSGDRFSKLAATGQSFQPYGIVGQQGSAGSFMPLITSLISAYGQGQK
jgi:hypothetical protein